MSDTGNAATIVFGTSAFTALYQEIGAMEQAGGALDDSDLSISTGIATKIPQDLHEPGEVACQFIWNPTDTPPPLHTPETVTITYPKENSGSASPATLAGTAFLTRRSFPSLKNNEINVGQFTLQWDGKTGPTYTPEA